jgi:DNA-binding SARP family transcriptional activator/tetratricopeptide (TPR) repeat protein
VVRGGGTLRVRVINGLAVDGIGEREIGSRKARTALKALAIAGGRAVSVDSLTEVLWPDDRPRDPPAQLAVIMSRLRRVLGSDRITYGDNGYALRADWLDLTAAAMLTAEAERRLRGDSPAAALAAARAASALFGRPLIDDVWPAEDRREVERLASRSRHLVARAALAAGDLATGVEAAEEALTLDSPDEEALRLAMAGLAAQGRTASALALHERFRLRLLDELGVSPSPQTDAAHRALLKGLPVPGVVVGPGRSELAGTSAVLAGREAELRRLSEIFLSVRDGRPAVAVLEGEAGIGKTAIATRWLDGLARDTTVLVAHCDQLSRALPLQPAVQLVRRHLRRLGEAGAREMLGADAPILEPLLDQGDGVREAVPDSSQSLPSSPAGIAALFAALRRVVTRACAEPSVLFVDDVQRADGLTVAWLTDLADATDLPLCILLTRRTNEGDVPRQSHVIAVPPLTRDAAVAIVGEQRAAALYPRSGGNALFLTQLARGDGDDAVPESISTAVVARCAEAGPAAETLRGAAVLGTRVDVDLLAAVLRGDPIHLLEDLERGVGLAILDERDGAYVFRHEIVREALEGSVSSPRRALLHREAARRLSMSEHADPMDLAHHARLSGARQIASAALTTASRVAASRFDYATAISLASEAVATEDTPPARLQRATILLRQARYGEAQDDAEAAVSGDGGARAWEIAGAIAYYCRDFERAAALGRALGEHAQDATQRVQALVIEARAIHAAGEVARADQLINAAMQICRDHHLRRPTSVYAFLQIHRGEVELSIRALGASPYASSETLSTIYTPVHAHFTLGYALATCGRAGEALRVLARASAEAERRGLVRYTALGINMSAWVHRNTGNLALARESNHRARDGARAAGYRELEVYATLDPCDDALDAGDATEAQRTMRQARELMGEPYAYRWRHELRMQLLDARVALLRGDAAGAKQRARSLITDAVTRCAPRYVHLAELLAMEVDAQLGTQRAADGALRTLSDALSRTAGLEAWWLLADLGAATGWDLCFELAREHRDRLAAALDPDLRAGFLTYAGARLDRMSSRGRTL